MQKYPQSVDYDCESKSEDLRTVVAETLANDNDIHRCLSLGILALVLISFLIHCAESEWYYGCGVCGRGGRRRRCVKSLPYEYLPVPPSVPHRWSRRIARACHLFPRLPRHREVNPSQNSHGFCFRDEVLALINDGPQRNPVTQTFRSSARSNYSNIITTAIETETLSWNETSRLCLIQIVFSIFVIVRFSALGTNQMEKNTIQSE